MAQIQIDVDKWYLRARALVLFIVLSAATWAAVEVALTARQDRDALLGTARVATCSADGRVVYLASGVAVLRSQDGGSSWAVVLPQQAPSAPPAASPTPAQAPVSMAPMNPADKTTARAQ